MAAPIKPIETDEEFEAAIKRLAKAAEEIEHPLISPELKAKYQAAYDRIEAYAEHYKIRDFASKFPYLRTFYEEQGRIGKDEVL